ncbi:MAG TPA: hypothetical protein VH575_05425 [Gemmataceae bacterium]|jgi:hypothetical protein
MIVDGFASFRLACSLALLGAVLLSGCEDIDSPSEPPAEQVVEIGQDFDATTAGTLRGRVTWEGAIPVVPSYRAPVNPGVEHSGDSRREWPNPNAPRIDSQTKAVAGAVVFLRGVDPKRSRRWDHPPVRVELRDYQIHVCQGERDGDSGFVRRGEAITMVSRQKLFHALRVRGAAFFARAFPDVDCPCTRRLDHAGIVELSSGCGHFWMHGRLFVTDHPYYTHTDAEGRFTLPQVPPGEYELVCWLPDWHEALRELDAETALICRLEFRPPVEVVQSVRLAPCQTRTIPIPFPAERFGR